MNGSDSAFPMVGGPQDQDDEPWHVNGLTKREYIEIEMMKAAVIADIGATYDEKAEHACRAADALIKLQKGGSI